MSVQLTDLEYGEKIVRSWTPRPDPEVVRLKVPQELQDRRIYAYVETIETAPYLFGGLIDLKYRGKPVGKPIPVVLADFTGLTIAKSVVCMLTSGGSPVGDSLSLTALADPFTVGTTSAVLQPFRVNGLIDEITFRIEVASGAITAYRVFLACQSIKY
jgi:hypothetical protein